jgi:hypothetical protein
MYVPEMCHILIEYMDHESELSKCYVVCSAWNCLSRFWPSHFGYEQPGLSESLLKQVALEVSLRQRPGSKGGRKGRGRERIREV